MNYYEILRVKQTATSSEIKSSYKELVKKYHPDLYVGDKDFAEQKIKEINEAYDVLSDPEKKAEYDEYLNPTTYSPNETQTYNSYKTNVNYDNYSQYSETDNSTQEQKTSFITQFIFDKFEKLDRKTQLQIFFSVAIIVLLLFTINILQTQYYLLNPDSNNSDLTNTNNFENITEPDLRDIDKYFYDLFEQYDQSLENASLENQNIFDNSEQNIFEDYTK